MCDKIGNEKTPAGFLLAFFREITRSFRHLTDLLPQKKNLLFLRVYPFLQGKYFAFAVNDVVVPIIVITPFLRFDIDHRAAVGAY